MSAFEAGSGQPIRFDGVLRFLRTHREDSDGRRTGRGGRARLGNMAATNIRKVFFPFTTTDHLIGSVFGSVRKIATTIFCTFFGVTKMSALIEKNLEYQIIFKSSR